MKKRRILTLLLSCLMVGSLAACDLDEDYGDYEEEEVEEEEEEKTVSPREGVAGPMQMTVNKTSGAMEIVRPVSQEIPMADDGSWTIFVYICGSNLESDDGSATSDMMEMCSATASDKVRFVVETGGAEQWQNDYADADSIGRFLIQDNEVVELDQLGSADMGDVATITDFLKWGVSEYPGERMGVVFWNHGSGSINGVCFDDLYNNDALTLREIDSALYSTFQGMTDRFEFIGFDACLMGTVETANILASYSRYMVGSQEWEPGYGWDYETIGNFLAENPEANGAEVGAVICDSFIESCDAVGQGDMATLSVINLDKVDDLVKSFNSFALEMYNVSEDTSTLSSMMRGIEGADNFGGNNRSEGYTNMVDLGGLIEACGQYTDADDVLNAMQDAVVYNKTGSTHKGCSGLSIYYPLEVEGSEELKVFEDVGISPFYSQFVDRQDFTSSIYYDPDSEGGNDEESEDVVFDEESGCYYYTEDGVDYCFDDEGNYWYYDTDAEEWTELETADEDEDDDCGYDEDYWFGEDDNWSSATEYDWDESSGCYRANTKQNDHWDYADNFEQTGESKYITFTEAPGLNDDGILSFTLDSKAVDYALDVYAYVYQVMEDDGVFLLLGETYDVYGDWETGHFEDGFDGYWLSLPDGQNLSTAIVSVEEDYVIYSASVEVNGKETNLRLKQSIDDYSVEIEGTWDGIDENGAAARAIRPIQEGDKIVPLYTAYEIESEGDEELLYQGVEYTVDSDFEIVYAYLDPSDYMYAMCIDDIYNDYFLSDFVCFNVDENGEVGFYVDE